MTVDFRATIATDLGVCISGDLSNNHISDGTGLIMTQGRLVMKGIVNPPRGTAVNLIVVRPQLGVITRFPKPLYVIRALPQPLDDRSEIEVGCRLTLMQDLKEAKRYWYYQYLPPEWDNLTPEQQVLAPKPIYAQKVLEFCLQKIGMQLAPGNMNRELLFRFLRASIDLSPGYVQVIGDLIRSESCYGRILPNGKLQVKPINFYDDKVGPVLTTVNFYSLEPVTGGAEPPDEYVVNYRAAVRPQTVPPSYTGTGSGYIDPNTGQYVIPGGSV